MDIKEIIKELKLDQFKCPKIGIHCETKELSNRVQDIFNKLGIETIFKKPYTQDLWDIDKEETVYVPVYNRIIRKNNIDDWNLIVSAEEFLELHK